MRQFEEIVAVDLPGLFDELALEEPVRAVLTRHADQLQDWMSGILEWHRRCARYTEAELRRVRAAAAPAGRPFAPAGIGTSAIRALLGG
jgi:germacradienol/geosmin synthase